MRDGFITPSGSEGHCSEPAVAFLLVSGLHLVSSVFKKSPLFSKIMPHNEK
jgi:hypothetical protein